MADIRVNAGGDNYNDVSGKTWAADNGFDSGGSFAPGSAISGTLDDTLYQSIHFRDFETFTYTASVSNGTYKVTLKFAEVYYGTFNDPELDPGPRIFDVVINGVTVLDNFNILAIVGPNEALDREFYVTVSGGEIEIQFVPPGDNGGIISGIEIVPTIPVPNTSLTLTGFAPTLNLTVPVPQATLSLTGFAPTVSTAGDVILEPAAGTLSLTGLAPTVSAPALAQPTVGGLTLTGFAPALDLGMPTAIRVNCGGDEYTDGQSNVWAADTGFDSGDVFSTGSSIGNTTDDTLYRTERYKVEPENNPTPALIYTFSVPNGSYNVKLKFAEIFRNNTGRVFNVEINGVLKLDDYDIWVEVGELTAVDKDFPIVVAGGEIEIVFSAHPGADLEAPKINAIEILSLDGTDVQPGVGSLALTGFAPSLALTVPVPATGLSLTGLTPLVVTPGAPAPATGTLSLTGFAPSLKDTLSIPKGALTLTGRTPTVVISLHPAVGSMILTGFAPAILTSSQVVTPATGTLSLTGLSPSLTLTIPVPAASLDTTRFTPTILAGDLLQPSAGSLTLTGLAPSLSLAVSIPSGALALTGFASSLSVTGNSLIQPAPAILLLTGNAPLVFGSVPVPPDRPNVFREHYIPWDEIQGNFDDLGEWDIAGLETGKANVFKPAVANGTSNVFHTRAQIWDEIPGNFDDIPGNFDEAGNTGGKSRVFK